MLRISKITDYGVLVAAHLVFADAPRSARALAEETHLPEPTVSKVLKRLARAEILVARRGAAGGYQLARPAGEITLVDLIGALEGPIAMTECNGCDRETACLTRVIWQQINSAVCEALEGVTLQEMAGLPDRQRPTKKATPLIQLAVGQGRASHPTQGR